MSASENYRLDRFRTGAVSRRGAVALMTIVLMLTMMAILGLVVEMSLLYHVEIQLHCAADAAALAGAAELIDEDVLYPNRPANQRDDMARARQMALAYAASNHVAGAALICDANENNDPGGDLVFGWLENPANRRAAMVLSDGEQPCNTLQVIAQRTRGRGNPVHLWFTSILGFAEADARCLSRATVDQRVYGFRPTPESNVPMAPLTVRGSGTTDSWTAQATASPMAGVNDRFWVDDRTNEVRDGSDGIPEIVLRFPFVSIHDAGQPAASPAEPNAGLLVISAGAWSPAVAELQLREGLGPDDLTSFDGEFALDESGRLAVAGARQLDKRLALAIAEIRGSKRVWPLYRNRHHREEAEIFELTGFAAGRVVDVRVEPDGAVVVFVQASVLITPTALVRPLAEGEVRNPWIGKLSLTL